jgi:hypothetical protein
MIVAVRTKSAGVKQAVIDAIKQRDPEATLNPEGNPVTFWVESKLSDGDIEKIEGVLDAVPSNLACSCGSGKYKEALHDARGIFCCYYCDSCEQEKRARYRTEVLEDSAYIANEEIEPEYNE